MTDDDYCQVATATDSREVADVLAGSAVQTRLAASAQVLGPITSTYWWQGTVVSSDEWRVTFRTTRNRYQQLEEHILARHNYQLPGIVCLPVVAGYQPYLEWITTETRDR